MMIMVVDPIYKPSVCVDRMIGAKRGKLGMEEAEKSCRPARAHARKSATSTTTKQAKNKHKQITKASTITAQWPERMQESQQRQQLFTTSTATTKTTTTHTQLKQNHSTNCTAKRRHDHQFYHQQQ